MTNVLNQRVFLGQANGADVELAVNGTELYATYETVDGYSAVYDEELGLYCYATVLDGRFASTRVPVTEARPLGLVLHARESEAVRQEKAAARAARMQRNTVDGLGKDGDS